jgi:DNA-binding response OmpR family regulator
VIRHGIRILVVEDDPSISRLLQLELEHRGMVVRVEDNGLAALAALEPFRPDAVVLDILLPGMDGEHVLSRIRAQTNHLPVIMLTARDAASDKIRNLNTGADDYLTKPFDIDELTARLGAVLRRVQPADVLRIGDLEIDADAVTVRRAGEPVALTAREFDLLHLLARDAGRVLSRDVILDRVWVAVDVDPNVVDVYIGYLRRKIDGQGRSPLIRTVRGVGFTLRDRDL